MLIYIIRHGETIANIEKRFQGWIDTDLNEKGFKVAEITGQALRGIHFDEAYSSPLRRAWHTTEAVLNNSGNENTPIFEEDRLKEINLGIWEGQKCAETEGASAFFEGGLYFKGAEGGESMMHLRDRIQEFLKELISRNDDKTYLISTHGCAVRAMLNFLYDNPDDFWRGHVPPNCGINILKAKDGKIEFVEQDKIYYDTQLMSDRNYIYK